MAPRITELPARLRRVPHLAQRRVGEEILVLDLRQARLFGFNPAAGALLERLRSGLATAGLAGAAAAAGAEPGEIDAFLATLVVHGLVEACEVEDAAPAGPEPGPWTTPKLLWQEDVARVTHQISPPQLITNPQCQP